METSSAEDTLLQYLSRVEEFSKWINFASDTNKVVLGTHLSSKGTPRVDATCKIGPMTFKSVWSKQSRSLEITALHQLVDGQESLLWQTAIEKLRTGYLKVPKEISDLLKQYDLFSLVTNVNSLVEKRLAAARKLDLIELNKERDRLRTMERESEVVRENSENRVKKLRSKLQRSKWMLLPIGSIIGYALTTLMAHTYPNVAYRMMFFLS